VLSVKSEGLFQCRTDTPVCLFLGLRRQECLRYIVNRQHFSLVFHWCFIGAD